MRKLATAIKEKISTEIGYYDWFSRYCTLEGPNDNDECKFACLAHGDSTPSASLNIKTGLWKCFSGGCGASGDAIDLYAIIKQTPRKADAIYALAVELGLISKITDEMVDAMHQDLIKAPNLVRGVCGYLGISEATIQRFLIGLHTTEIRGHSEGRITIPIRGTSGFWEDVRRYHPKAGNQKMLHWAAGHGAPRVFPIDALRKNETVILFEGEKDTLRAHDLGITNAITITAGAGSLPPDYPDLFDGKTVYLCYDIDAAGIQGANRVIKKLATCVRALYRIQLPPEGLPDNGDFSDWCNLGNGKDEFDCLIASAALVNIDAARRLWSTGKAHIGDEILREDPKDLQLIDYQDIDGHSGCPEAVRFLAHSIGVSAGMKPFIVATELQVTCGRNQPKLCPSCRINQLDADTSPHTFQIDLHDEAALRLIRCDDAKKRAALKRLCGIPNLCPSARIIETGRGTFQQLLLSPPADLQSMRESYGGFKFAYLSCPAPPDNRDYWFTGRVQPDPKTQEIILNLHRADPARSAIESFEVNDETFDAIDYFKPTVSELPRHFGRLTDGISRHVGVYGRPEIALAVLETIYSAARFRFGGREIYPGVVETLIIGDPRTGKSKLAVGMMRMINVGEYITCENVSAAGLVVGLEQIDDHRIPIWGAWPRNHNGFMILDEFDELSKNKARGDLIAMVSSVRSSSVAETTKIVRACHPALVRLCCITNPVDGKMLSTYNGAIRAIPGVIPGLPDIARFTKAYAVAMETVSTDQIAGMTVQALPEEVCRFYNTLAILTWSLKPEQIEFTEAAEQFLKRKAQELVERYDPGIPLIDPGSCLDKVARLSIPAAVLSGSFKEVGDSVRLTVEEQHAFHAVNSLIYYYDQDTMGYHSYSRLEKEMNQIKDVAQVESLFGGYTQSGITAGAIARFFLSQPHPTAQSWREFLGNPTAAQSAWGVLVRSNCLRLENQIATKTPDFVKLLQRHLD